MFIRGFFFEKFKAKYFRKTFSRYLPIVFRLIAFGFK